MTNITGMSAPHFRNKRVGIPLIIISLFRGHSLQVKKLSQ